MKARDRWTNSASATARPPRPPDRFAGRVPPAFPRRSVFVVLLALAPAAPAGQADADGCRPSAIARWAHADYVHDGDTVWLDDGAKVRIIGLNAPELARDNRPGEPFAEQARDVLRRLLTGKVGVEYDEERKDRYGRVLAHVYSESLVNAAAQVIKEGFAHAVTFPPNLKHRRCYRAAEQAARATGAGIWSHQYFAPVAAAQVARGGFMRVKGCVKSTRNTRKTTYLKLTSGFRLKVSRADFDDVLAPFARDSSPGFSGACLVARGWVYNDKRSNVKTLTIRHSDAIETVTHP